MKKVIALAVLIAFGFTAGFTGSVFAQRKHAPPLLQASMVERALDVQRIVTALAVFDMKRIAQIAERRAKTDGFFAKWPKLPVAWKPHYTKLAATFNELAAAAKAGEENVIADKVAVVLKVCNACHYNIRDAKRREKK